MNHDDESHRAMDPFVISMNSFRIATCITGAIILGICYQGEKDAIGQFLIILTAFDVLFGCIVFNAPTKMPRIIIDFGVFFTGIAVVSQYNPNSTSIPVLVYTSFRTLHNNIFVEVVFCVISCLILGPLIIFVECMFAENSTAVFFRQRSIRLRRHIIQATSSETFEDCSVCLQPMIPSDEVNRVPGCQHQFHADCLTPWLANNPSCPLCRRLVVSDVEAPPVAVAVAAPNEVLIAVNN